MRSACSGVKFDSIVVPVFSSSVYVLEGRREVGARRERAPLLGLKKEIVAGRVTSVVTVRMK